MAPEAQAGKQPSPAIVFDTLNGYQRTQALKTAIELELFTAIGEGNTTAKAIAERCGASVRGTRIVCDFLTINGFLTKQGDDYSLTPDSATFLDKRSPAYMGTVTNFILSSHIREPFEKLTETVRNGFYAADTAFEPNHPMWVEFARSMQPMMALPSQLMAQLVDPTKDKKLRVLDIAAGHGLFGIAFAKQNPQLEVTAVDWPRVLEVAKENAQAAGVSDRYQTNPGSAFDVDYGTGYDLVLLTNFLHHFDKETCETLLRKVHAALAEGGRAVALEFVPNDDRITPPQAAAFSMQMLGGTPTGDAYTFAELQQMFQNAGFARSEMHELPPTIERVVVSYK
ncbi:MAG TPA: class I SAM-dependent methyltransferase [Pyrinomonadaceae bacterium]|jgi:ubiquinone/menaquinone biosynthesis C-methylase UbiE|nr:class I SAM-dependent methyltransferase [Pyrinomonadaceae bacterium]